MPALPQPRPSLHPLPESRVGPLGGGLRAVSRILPALLWLLDVQPGWPHWVRVAGLR